jgi:hypothetical protein
MRDEDGPVIARAFYQELFKSENLNEDAVPYALDVAVAELRGRVSPERWASFVHFGA